MAATFTIMAEVLCPFCNKLEECTVIKPGTIHQTYECPTTKNHFEAQTYGAKKLPTVVAGATLFTIITGFLIHIFGGGGNNNGNKYS